MEIKTPLPIILDMAKKEIEAFIQSCMNQNQIPSELMIYVLNSISLSLAQSKSERMADEYVALQQKFLENNENNKKEENI